MMIGPEGGFTEEECQWLKEKGWQQVSLGQRILRIETAAIMMAATWAACQNSDA
jgi:16S rRNA (uracil1498-N3)-methyltransferase